MNEIDASVPDRWLRVFSAAAEAESFTEAARRLGIGQSAVSHAVSRIERSLGVTLFERRRAGARLTADGATLAESVRTGFETIDRAVELSRISGVARPLTVSVSTSLATYWLMPRLARFKQRHPNVDLRCITSDTDRGIGTDGADLWIPLGTGPWPGFSSAVFCEEEIYPVASALLFDDSDEPVETFLRDPARLAQLRLLSLEERYRARFDWARWFEHIGAGGTTRAPEVASNDYSLILQAALDGQGIALGWHHIVRSLVADGRLLRLSHESVVTDEPFVILQRADRERSANASAFQDWLISEASQ